MALHQESDAKQASRDLILEACVSLQRNNLTYLGMPAEAALDIKTLRPVLQNVICVAETATILAETKRSIATLRLIQKRFRAVDIWAYLRDEYPSEQLVADLAFLDFYGGGIVKEDPFATEIAGLRSYFAKQARFLNRAFVFAWTFMPHDKGKGVYVSALEKQKMSDLETALVKSANGVRFRAIALRVVLRQILDEHGFTVKVFHQLLYKQVMSTMILVFCKGVDPLCRLQLAAPETLIFEPYYAYEAGRAIPRQMSLVE
jgi:hypothetical protein